ncbi:LLM class flavin-dependent oxidoreductase [Actinopolymorpha cephalotaxi]|uniref:Alkanesulfonate monooxygenase SsuD/methylene tetrahydromethanopterin reductase-like flavin-dependent oxidoreductase (Luciferase family) n=2 Tax=Actinopolymorpha cephalotaxi TaxID=504797 RepID=A0ABX2S0H0_9ACTN|nr:LLM class flavin-dependent oxidoreductase [Actinopolymorpha cephalotaxi]NYH82804.1 alkanesulfonate monooxygenase SsuD/methylene tetrahydromethanopterin reductase-like flavin-dependent oxidoreductase (luciferase family) [Actinopolymorpha cephalotaxi]
MTSVGAMFPCAIEPEALPSYAHQVEALGYQELWVVEDCFFAGGIAAATAALAATERLAIGIGVLPAVMRNPATAALELSTLLRIFPGRVLPGFGHGVASWMEQIGALPPSQLAALGESVAAVRALLAGETVTTSGRHVRLDDVTLRYPIAEPPPISLGVRAEKSLRLSGRVADGTVLSELSAPAYLRWARERVDAGRAEAGRTDPHRYTVYAYLGLDEDGEWAVRRSIARVLRGDCSVQLGPLGIAEEAAELARDHAEEEDLAEALPREWVHQLAVTGTPDEAAKTLREFHDAGADSVVFVPTGDPTQALSRLAQAAAVGLTDPVVTESESWSL